MPERPPSVDRLLSSKAFAALIEGSGRMVVRDALREVQARHRQDRAGAQALQGEHDYAQQVEELLKQGSLGHGGPVFNMTGVLLHSNLGRATLDAEIASRVARETSGHVLLELDARTGKRGDREASVQASLQALTGAEAAAVVNNNAAAVMLMLATLRTRARNEVIVSRGELVEIGGSFRLPEIMRVAGVRLVEVGTTNVTRPDDYAAAMNEKTAAILKVHTSNYSIHGYTGTATIQELAAINQTAGIPLCVDLGSGCLVDMTQYGLPAEPRVTDALSQGAKLVTFSGDKLLGSVQSGIILGDQTLIARINRHPMKRAMRLDKLRLALLQETLKAYQDPDSLAARVPLLRQLGRSISELTSFATSVAQSLAPMLDEGFSSRVVPHAAEMGSGSMPGVEIPSIAVEVKGPSQVALKRFDRGLRILPTPVIGRIHEGSLLLDVRAVEDLDALVQNLQSLRAS